MNIYIPYICISYLYYNLSTLITALVTSKNGQRVYDLIPLLYLQRTS